MFPPGRQVLRVNQMLIAGRERNSVSHASQAMMEGSLTFSTCLELLEEHFSRPCLASSLTTTPRYPHDDAYFNLGAFLF